jgi:hypothetical protein
MQAVLAALRAGSWLTRERIRLVAIACLALSAIALAGIAVTARGLDDYKGRPVGTDFASFYAAGAWVLDGRPDAPFDPALQFAREKVIFGPDTQFYAWQYPPFFLLVAALLALLPYFAALAVWQAGTFALYLFSIAAVIRSTAPGRPLDRMALLLAAAYPAVFINAGHGQNGFLSAALLGLGLAFLRPRPVVAGMCFGLLAYKPQLGLVIPFALAAGGYWRTIAAAAATVIALALLATAAFGADIWQAFLASTAFTRETLLEQGGPGFEKIQSVFAAIRLWGGSVSLAYGIQGAASLAVVVLAIRLWRGNARFPLKAAGLTLATLLASPFSLDYDLMVLAPAIAFLAMNGLRHGFAPWEGTALAALWLVPLVARAVAGATLVPLGLIAMLAVFTLLVRRTMLPPAARAGRIDSGDATRQPI